MQKYCFRLIKEIVADLCHYYFNAFPILLFIGMLRRIKRRFKCLFLTKGKGQPPISEDLVFLIVDMKRHNHGWGALRISQELALMGISVCKKTVQKVLIESGMIPPKLKFTPPTWKSLINSACSAWAMDFMSVFDAMGGQLFASSLLM